MGLYFFFFLNDWLLALNTVSRFKHSVVYSKTFSLLNSVLLYGYTTVVSGCAFGLLPFGAVTKNNSVNICAWVWHTATSLPYLCLGVKWLGHIVPLYLIGDPTESFPK